MARPKKIDQEGRAVVLATIRMGASLQDAAAMINVHRSTLVRLRKHDKQLRQEIEAARAKCKAEALKRITSSTDWRAAAWFLERRWPQEYGRSIRDAAPAGEGNDDRIILIRAVNRS